MDMNEVNNNSVAALLLQGRQNVVNSAVSEQGFAELLASVDVKIVPESEFSSEAKSSYVSSKNVPYKTSVSDKEASPIKDKAEKKEKVKNTSDDYRKTEVKSSDTEVVADNRPVKQKMEKVDDSEGDEIVVSMAVKTPEVKADDGVDEAVAEAYKLPLSFVASLDVVCVFNPDTHESFQMSGVELAERLASGEFPDAMIMYLDNGRDVNAVVEEAPVFPEELSVDGKNLVEEMVASESKAEGNGEKSVKKTSANNEKIELPEVDVATEEVVAPLSEVDKQAEKIAQMLDEGRKVKIEVNVDEESFSYRSAKDMTVSLLPVEENIVESGKVVSSTEKNSSISSVDGQQTVQSPQASVTIASPSMSAVTENAETVSAISSEPAPVSMANAGAQSNEALNQGKMVAANDDKTSFREVYKGLSRETIDQIKVNITKSAVKGVDKIQIQLKPEDLGSIEVKMQIGKDGKLQAHIISGRPETMEILQKEVANLEKAFSDAGFQMDEGGLSFSFRESNSQNEQGRDEELRQFIGNVFERETVQEQVAGDEYLQGTASNGLNIRV